jgi:hypothetical protein
LGDGNDLRPGSNAKSNSEIDSHRRHARHSHITGLRRTVDHGPVLQSSVLHANDFARPLSHDSSLKPIGRHLLKSWIIRGEKLSTVVKP